MNLTLVFSREKMQSIALTDVDDNFFAFTLDLFYREFKEFFNQVFKLSFNPQMHLDRVGLWSDYSQASYHTQEHLLDWCNYSV